MNPRLRDLLTILYRPRETMRSILDASDRWTVQVVVLAVFCTSVNDSDVGHVSDVLPGLTPFSIGALAILALIGIAIGWVLVVFLLSWLVTFVGHLLGGTGPVADVRAAIAWGLAPLIWSAIPRIPIAVYQAQLNIGPEIAGPQGAADFLARGGCAFAVVVFALQIVVFAAWLYVTSFTVAEAQRFSTPKGFANVALTIAGPVLIIAAAVFAFHATR